MNGKVIAFQLQAAVELFILPTHTSHMLQSLEIDAFAPLERALACEGDTTYDSTTRHKSLVGKDVRGRKKKSVHQP